ncbi:hypothetical protein [Solibacillus isronensis]|uniref:hypothetical protein n=1 Tax=Solibacillus isronensis TaxID=412383 RepID=UPI00399F9802
MLNATGNSDINYGPATGLRTIDGNVTINGNATGNINLRNLKITGNLTVNTPGATVNNSASVDGTITIQDVSGNTWNEFAVGNKLVLNDNDGDTNLVIKESAHPISITVNANATVTIDVGASVDTLTIGTAVTSATVTNNGSITTIDGDGNAEVTGTGTVESNTNNAFKAKEAAQNAIDAINELEIYAESYKTAVAEANTKVNAARDAGVTDTQIGSERVAKLDAANDFLAPVSATITGSGEFIFGEANTFNVKATSKIGSKGTVGVHYAIQEWISSPFTYTTDGAFYAISLTKDGEAVEFSTAFDTFALQTQGSTNTQEYTQTLGIGTRLGGDFGVTGVTHKGTSIYADGTNEAGTLYYGIHSAIAGVNYTKGATAAIDMTGTLKSDAVDGNYKITVTMYAPAKVDKVNKHVNKGSLNALGTVEYTFTVPTSTQ